MPQKTVHFPPDVMQRVRWIAEAKATTPSEVIRDAVQRATADARPPVKLEEKAIAATDAEWELWRDAAIEVGIGLDELIRRAMNDVARRVFKG